MKNLNEFGVQEMDAKEIKALGGGNLFIDYVIAKGIDALIDAAIETHKRGTLMNMNQVDVKLWG